MDTPNSRERNVDQWSCQGSGGATDAAYSFERPWRCVNCCVETWTPWTPDPTRQCAGTQFTQWLVESWLRNYLGTYLVEPIRATPSVLTEPSNDLAPLALARPNAPGGARRSLISASAASRRAAFHSACSGALPSSARRCRSVTGATTLSALWGGSASSGAAARRLLVAA